MIRFLYGDALAAHPRLSRQMFRDRARQFRDRLGWSVSVDEGGLERDAYDALNPLYVIATREGGGHGGSMRFLPTTGRTMVNEHFLALTGGVRIESPLIWECTRFCLSPLARRDERIAPRLMLAAAEMGRRFGLAHAVGVFDARMLRVYRALGWAPDLVGGDGDESAREQVAIGLWDFAAAPLDRLRRKARVSPAEVASWFEGAFAPRPVATRAPAQMAGV